MSAENNFSREFYTNYGLNIDNNYPYRSGSNSQALKAVIGAIPWTEKAQYNREQIKEGFRLIFHDPFELPSEQSKQFFSKPNIQTKFLISPEMTSIDDSLFDETPEE